MFATSIRSYLLLCTLLSPALCAAAKDDVAERARQAMAKATSYLSSIATGGGYAWRYSTDLQVRVGKSVSSRTQIWIRPPGGTPAMGLAFITAYKATGDAVHLDAARQVGSALVFGQLQSGGWDIMVDFDEKQAARWLRQATAASLSPEEVKGRKNFSSYDDNNTQTAVSFLIEYCSLKGMPLREQDQAICRARDYALDKLIEAQYGNGAWPQLWDGKPHGASHSTVKKASYPSVVPAEHPKQRFWEIYTTNDDLHRDLVLLFLKAYGLTARNDYLEAAKRGGEFILRAQMPDPQPVWAQQYNLQMEPAWARVFEPPAVASRESVGLMRTLMELHVVTGDERWLSPIAPALEWFERSQVAPNTWARLYELRTNKPIYGDIDGRIHYRLDELTEERRQGYSWQGNYGYTTFVRAWRRLQAEGREKFLAARSGTATPASDKARRTSALQKKVEQILDSLDESGRWTTAGTMPGQAPSSAGVIDTAKFAENLTTLAEFVEISR